MHRALLSVFVDDPCVVVAGQRQDRSMDMTAVIFLWLALGFKLSFHKGARGAEVAWIGGTLEWHAEGFTVGVKPSLLEDLLGKVNMALAANVLPVKTGRSLAGLACHVASVI